jgi:hypothetical protein
MDLHPVTGLLSHQKLERERGDKTENLNGEEKTPET